MNALHQHGLSHIWHVAPLHYLSFIGRFQSLKSKARLRADGFNSSNFRSTSRSRDESLGFSDVIHLFPKPSPRILLSKLKKGYPHVENVVPADSLAEDAYIPCWYNIAMNRERDPAEGPSRGYVGFPFELPVARTADVKSALLRSAPQSKWVEVLVPNLLPLPSKTEVTVFGDWDLDVARETLKDLGIPWKVGRRTVNAHPPLPGRRLDVQEFLRHSMADASWRGDGPEYRK